MVSCPFKRRRCDMKPWPMKLLVELLVPAVCAAGAFGLSHVFIEEASQAWASVALALLAARIAFVDASRFIIPPLELLLLGLLGLVLIIIDPAPELLLRLLESLVRALAYGLIFELVRRGYLLLRQRHGMGFGDVKLAAASGLWLDPQAFAIAVFCASITGIIVFMVLHYGKDQRRQSPARIPFGTMLAPWLWLVWFGTNLAGL
jgi:leader peptidase (prepilin peptidase) / N-methyltransferase